MVKYLFCSYLPVLLDLIKIQLHIATGRRRINQYTRGAVDRADSHAIMTDGTTSSIVRKWERNVQR